MELTNIYTNESYRVGISATLQVSDQLLQSVDSFLHLRCGCQRTVRPSCFTDQMREVVHASRVRERIQKQFPVLGQITKRFFCVREMAQTERQIPLLLHLRCCREPLTEFFHNTFDLLLLCQELNKEPRDFLKIGVCYQLTVS